MSQKTPESFQKELERVKEHIEDEKHEEKVSYKITARKRAAADRFSAEDILICLKFSPGTDKDSSTLVMDLLHIIFEKLTQLVSEIQAMFDDSSREYLAYFSIHHDLLQSNIHQGKLKFAQKYYLYQNCITLQEASYFTIPA